MSSDREGKLRPEDVASATAVGAATRIGTAKARRAASAEGAGAGAAKGARKSAAPTWPAAVLVVAVLAVMLTIMIRFGQ